MTVKFIKMVYGEKSARITKAQKLLAVSLEGTVG